MNLIFFALTFSCYGQSAKGILDFDEFTGMAQNIARNYLGTITAKKARCTKDLKLRKDGEVECYAFAAGDRNKPLVSSEFNPDNIADAYFNPNISIYSSIYLSVPKAFIGADLNKMGADYVLTTTDKDPNCKLAQFHSVALQNTLQGEGSITLGNSTSELITEGFIAGGSLSYTTPFEGLVPSLTVEATHEYRDSIGKISEATVGQTFNSVHGSSCTPYGVTFGLVCDYTKYNRVLSQNGENLVENRYLDPRKGTHIVPNQHNTQYFLEVVGCVEFTSR
ncbi:hypothetical protein DSO57_1029345 [Entomophthora muscae]|uniref:Uncharacterized protein n=2 Tax=Entomophthora muscae TaxID=34485 RepID=A0ACC2SMV2_9FUNG|nr:hypothetical protein DSO57_1039569 [Entomophthora muscae]KAJ9072270.1 hypothetical protein DSO57_1029345 [Entomophthora muscae]